MRRREFITLVGGAVASRWLPARSKPRSFIVSDIWARRDFPTSSRRYTLAFASSAMSREKISRSSTGLAEAGPQAWTHLPPSLLRSLPRRSSPLVRLPRSPQSRQRGQFQS
jgi:hypothetical protein